MKKVVINSCLGGFGLSIKAEQMLWKLKGYDDVYFYKPDYVNKKYKKIIGGVAEWLFICSKRDYGEEVEDLRDDDCLWVGDIIDREDLDLIKVIETLGVEANRVYANLKIIEIPDDVEYYIDCCDGKESIHEKHKVWEQ